MMHGSGTVPAGVESRYAWLRLAAALALNTIGSVGFWSEPVALPAVQVDFAAARGEASLAFTLAMLGLAAGGVLLGRLSDRFGVVLPLLLGVAALCLGYIGAGFAPNLLLFTLCHVLIGFGASASFGPLVADTSQWFSRRRALAVAIASCGVYAAGAIWPPVLQHFIATAGWRWAHVGTGIVCLVSMLPLMLVVRRRLPKQPMVSAEVVAAQAGLSPNALQVALCLAGVACCVAMSMPQVHIVAYCGDLGYGVAHGADMLALMTAFGIPSRIVSGLLADRIGGVATLLLGSALQGLALLLYLFFDGLASLYLISALFGLFQGGIVAMYAVIVREYFPPREAGMRLGLVLMATLLGMALGGWMSGLLFDVTGSYHAAFVNGLLFNLVNASIMLWLLMRPGQKLAPA